MSNARSPIDESCRRSFERAWIETGAAEIDDHLPPRDASPYAPTLIELILIDMEMRARTGRVPSVASYVEQYDLDASGRERLEAEAAYLESRRVGEGTRIGRYVLGSVIGRGAFATVWRARDAELDRSVALKRLRADFLLDPEARQRFRREARSAARLRHPAIVTVHEVGEDAGGPYIVADLIGGPTLAEALRTRPFEVGEAVDLVTRIADGLEYAHQCGVVHRDVKPGNVLLDEAGRAMLTDFGLARLGEAEATLTRQGQLLGTPAYMSPEQARGASDRVDHRSDVYSLGVVLYELLCGRPPFRGDPAALAYAVVHKPVPRPRSIRPRIPPDLETICLKALAREPAQRYATAADFAADLRRFRAQEPIQARRSGPLAQLTLWARRNPALAGSLALGTVIACVAFLLVLRERTRFEAAHRRSQANLHLSLVRQAEAQLAVPLGAARDAAWASLHEALEVETGQQDLAKLRTLAVRCLTADGPYFARGATWAPHAPVAALTLAPDAAHVVEVGTEGIRLRRVADGAVVAHDDRGASTAAFAPDGSVLAVARATAVHLLDPTTLAPRRTIPSRAPVRSLAFDPSDPARLAWASTDGQVDVIRIGAADVEREASLAYDAHGLGFGPRNRLALACADGGVRQVDLTRGAVMWTARFEEPARQVVARGGRVAAFSHERLRVTLFDAETGAEREPERLHEAALRAIGFGRGGRLLVASSDGLLVAYDEDLTRVAQRRVAGAIQRAAIAGETLVTLDAEGRMLATTLRQPLGVVRFRGNHRAVFLPGDGGLFNGTGRFGFTASEVRPLRHARSPTAVWGVAAAPDGRHVARATHAGRIELLDAESLEPVAVLKEAGPIAWTVAISPDGRVLAAGSGDDVLLFDLPGGALRHRLEAHEGMVSALAFRGPELVSAARDRTLRRWRWDTGEALGVLDEDLRAYDLAVEGDDLYAACRDGCVRIYGGDASAPRIIRLGREPVWAVGVGPDGLLAAGTQSGRVRLLDARSGTPLFELRANPRVRSVGFDPSGRYLAASVYVAPGSVFDLDALHDRLDALGLGWR